MYRPAETWLGMAENEDGTLWYVRERLVSNGSHLRRKDGLRLRSKPKRRTLVCAFQHQGELYDYAVKDAMAVRIVDYFENYFTKYITNCASFAHFVMTGVFQECDPEIGYLVNEQTYSQFQPDKPVQLGDVLFILYANKRYLGSRKLGVHQAFRRCKKKWHDTGEFTAGLGLNQSQFTKQRLRELYNSRLFEDFHFMVCIGHHERKPIWISQIGWHEPGTEEVYFAITVGFQSPYPEKVPAVVLIKRRRS